MTGRKSVLTTENKGQIILLKKQGLSVRKIAVEVGISKSDAVAPVAPTVPLIKLPHSHQITDEDIEQLKQDLKYPDINYHSLIKGHQKKCHCYKCCMIRKKNLIALKNWQSQNVTRTEDNE